jgi:hypothetical protein
MDKKEKSNRMRLEKKDMYRTQLEIELGRISRL